MNIIAPVVLFVYNRPNHLLQTVNALKANYLADQTDLFVFSDGPKNEDSIKKVSEVREIIKSLKGFKQIILKNREVNVGLSQNIIEGVTDIVNKYGKIIVLEDDLVTGPYFLKFMNNGLDLYENEENISQIIGYSYYEKYAKKFNLSDGVFIRGADCLGWGTWSRAWKKFNPDGSYLLSEIKRLGLEKEFNFRNHYDYTEMLRKQSQGLVNSWAIRWMASAFLENMYSYFPTKSLVLHIGNDRESSNYYLQENDPLNVPVYQEEILPKKIAVTQDLLNASLNAHVQYLKGFRQSVISKIVKRFKSVLNKLR